MKATIIREYQRDNWIGKREMPVYVEYDGANYLIESGHTEEIELNPRIKHLRFVVPDMKQVLGTDDTKDYVKTVIFSEVTDIIFKVRIRWIFNFKLIVEANKKVKVKNR